jgi:hypothetical protein
MNVQEKEELFKKNLQPSQFQLVYKFIENKNS